MDRCVLLRLLGSLGPLPGVHEGDGVCVKWKELVLSNGGRDASTALKSPCGLRLISFSASARPVAMVDGEEERLGVLFFLERRGC